MLVYKIWWRNIVRKEGDNIMLRIEYVIVGKIEIIIVNMN